MNKRITKKNLKIGAILPIFSNWQEQKDLRGTAVLLERLQSRESPLIQREYEFSEIGSTKKDRQQEKVQILYAYQWWKITYIDGKYKGFTTAVKIAYYSRTFWKILVIKTRKR